MSKKYYSLVSVLVMVVFLVTACATATPTSAPAAPVATESQTGAATSAPVPTEAVVEAPTAAPMGPTEFIFGLSDEPKTLEPAVNAGTSQRAVKLAIYRGLFNYGKGGVLTPELASDYTISEDGLTYTITLRDAVFHNGDPVTAEDVKFSLERILNPDVGATFFKQMSVIDTVVATDAKTVTITLKQTMAPFLDYLALPESVIVSKSWVDAGGDLAVSAMGAGPFVFVEYASGQYIKVEKFADYYKEGLPKSESILFEFYKDANTRVTALQAGDVDLIEYVPWKDFEMLSADSALQVLGGTGPFMGLVFNTNNQYFSNPLVRQAVAYAIDRQAVINTAFSGAGEPIFGMNIPPSSLAYKDEYANYFTYNPEKAKELLAQAGYPDGFTVRLLATSQYAFHQDTAIAVQAELKKVGIEVELDLPDWATRQEKTLKGDHDFVVVGTAGDVSDPDYLSDFYESSEEGRLNSAPGFKDARIDELLAEGRSVIDPEARKAIYYELQERALELSPLVYLMWRSQAYAADVNLAGFQPLPGFLSFQSGIMLEETYLTE